MPTRLCGGRTVAALNLALACVLVLCGCTLSPHSAQAKSDPVILRIGSVEVNSADPLYGIQQLTRLLTYEGLIGNSRDGRSRPRLAESWTVSPDGLRWSFRLRRGAEFHDGTPVDALTVKQSLDKSLTNLTDRSLFRGLEDIVEIQAPESNEIVIRLRERSSFLLDDLFVPISKTREDGTTIGTGPFMEPAVSAQQIVMARFPAHYLGTPEINSIVWKPYPAIRSAWAAMMRGELDFLYEVGRESVEFVEVESSTKTFSVIRPYVFGVVFNSNSDLFQDVRIRRALNYAVDRPFIVERALRNRGLVADTPIWPMHWAYDQNVTGYMYDPGRAAAILDRIGDELAPQSYPDGQSRRRRLSFSCLLPENVPEWERIALVVQRQLSQIGVEMDLEAVPIEVFNNRIEQGRFDSVFLEIVGGPSMSIPYVFWHSSSSRNSFGFASDGVDAALDGIRRAPDDDAYRHSVRRLQESMINDPPGVFLAWGQTARAVSRRFQVPDDPERGDVLLSLGSWHPVDASRERSP